MNPYVSEEQLFDTEQDPHEIHNLVDSDKQEHREALIGMRSALDTWIVEQMIRVNSQNQKML